MDVLFAQAGLLQDLMTPGSHSRIKRQLGLSSIIDPQIIPYLVVDLRQQIAQVQCGFCLISAQWNRDFRDGFVQVEGVETLVPLLPDTPSEAPRHRR